VTEANGHRSARIEQERALRAASESVAALDAQIATETEGKLAAVKEAIEHRRARADFEARGRKAAEVRARVEALAAQAARAWAEVEEAKTRQTLAQTRAALAAHHAPGERR
jgi:hypothetical protein